MKRTKQPRSRISQFEKKLADAEAIIRALSTMDVPGEYSQTKALVKKYSEADRILKSKKTVLLIELCHSLESAGKELSFDLPNMWVLIKEGGIGIRMKNDKDQSCSYRYPGYPELVKNPEFNYWLVCQNIIRWIENFVEHASISQSNDAELLRSSLAKLTELAKDNTNAADK